VTNWGFSWQAATICVLMRVSRALYLAPVFSKPDFTAGVGPDMTRKQRRAAFIVLGLAILGIAVALVLNAMRDSIVFFYSPSDIAEKGIGPGERLRLGGLVEQGSVVKSGSTDVTFTVTDFGDSIRVHYKGILPDLFREGQGVVAEGELTKDGTFEADTVLAKHDEKYMPPEVAQALKKRGDWQGDEDFGKPHAEKYGEGSYP